MVEPLRSTPIRELHLSRVEEIYIPRIYQYLEGLGCTVKPEPGPLGKHHIIFPDRTMEELYAGQSTQWNRRTTIRFPTGETLTKIESTNVRDSRIITTHLAFPKTILEGSETPECTGRE